MSHRATKMVAATAEAVRAAAEVLRGGGLVAFPTETVYGLGADALNPSAMRDLFLAKGRPPDHPVIVHLADAQQVAGYVAEFPPAADKLAAAFWPGPLTLVLRRGPLITDLVTGGLETVGIRVPGHPVAQALLKEFGGPIAAPSANPFGRVSATRAEHVLADLTGRADLILDGGPCQVGLESTIVDLVSTTPAVLRPGAITREQIAAALSTEVGAGGIASPRVSGNLPSHYAPRAKVELVSADDLARRAQEVAAMGVKVVVLTSESWPRSGPNLVVLSVGRSDEDLGRELYARLREADELGASIILITLPPETGMGAALADRLRRAAGPRE